MTGSSNEYMNNYMKNRWTKRRLTAIEKLGGKRKECNSTENLQFDHIDRLTKIASIADMSSMSEIKFWAEVDKCQLLCLKCHQKKTLIDLNQKDAKINHGTLSSYRYCHCELCKKAQADYVREYRKTHKRKS